MAESNAFAVSALLPRLKSASARSDGSASALAIVDDPASRFPAAIWDVPRLKARAGVGAMEVAVANDCCASAYFFSANCFTPRALAACEFVSRVKRLRNGSVTRRTIAIGFIPHLDLRASRGT